jgi:hypothetical protein
MKLLMFSLAVILAAVFFTSRDRKIKFEVEFEVEPLEKDELLSS